jgi:CelD/BcsL family acetyltransferase involved in cellulose biosynthesis
VVDARSSTAPRPAPAAGGVAPALKARLQIATELGAWAEAWDELVTAAPLPTPFSRSWWLSAVAAGPPRFLLVTAGSELIGGLALEERRVSGVGVLRMMGAGPLCPDHLDLLAAPGRETTVRDAVAAWLRQGRPRVIRLEGLVEDAMVADALPSPVRTRPVAVAPYTALGAKPFLESRSRNLRHSIRQAERRMAEVGVVYRRVPAIEVETSLRTLHALHVHKWGRSPFVLAFDRFAAAARAGAAAGEVSFHELALEECPIASLVCFEVEGRASFYQSGRSADRQWRSGGTVLLYRAIDQAQRRGFTEFDLLRGDEGYKASFATMSREVRSVEARTGLGGRIMLDGMNAYARVRKVASRARTIR